MAKFPTAEWLEALQEKLNRDPQYAQIARNWEGALSIIVEPDGAFEEPFRMYMDLRHGKCREAYVIDGAQSPTTVVSLSGPYDQYIRLLKGEMEPIQALLTRKLSVTGSMSVIMRNVPTVLDFVRCCREVTDSFV